MQNIPFLRIEKQHDYNCFPFIFHSGHVLPLGGQNGKNINWAIWIGRISDQVDSAWSTPQPLLEGKGKAFTKILIS